eukprot:CAMPEP_0195588536 /NCGR_PEP_ID=MMETSP0814-20130614/32833_1 /TAXON_ID=97485 /ORGANISM="Prymnesium parvum, Strain Texoma1" /LENGTH=191 /DNA_ID=CAMNT_0040727499 /DNA_START=163 /DNA_END=734 /DNA_ORIENTATION=-
MTDECVGVGVRLQFDSIHYLGREAICLSSSTNPRALSASDARAVPSELAGHRVPAKWVVAHVRGHLLHLQIIVQSPLAQLAPDAAPLKPAPRRLHEARLAAVDPHDAGLHRVGDSCATPLVRRENRGGQAEGGVIGQLDRLRLGGEGGDREHGAEHLSPPDLVARRVDPQDGRLVVEALRARPRPLAAGEA